jgi:ribonuclease HI
MSSFALFTDVSLNPQQRLGIGACLLLTLPLPLEPDPARLASLLHYSRFAETSSTRLELQTVLLGLQLYREQHPGAGRGALTLYSDSQAVVGLPGRRTRLEGRSFGSARSGGQLAHADLYRDFYAAVDELGFALVKLAGHSPAAGHSGVQRIFAAVDRGARQELQRWLASA